MQKSALDLDVDVNRQFSRQITVTQNLSTLDLTDSFHLETDRSPQVSKSESSLGLKQEYKKRKMTDSLSNDSITSKGNSHSTDLSMISVTLKKETVEKSTNTSLITIVKHVSFQAAVAEARPTANAAQATQSTNIVIPIAEDYWRQCRSAISNSEKSKIRALHLTSLMDNDNLPPWSVGLAPIPPHLVPDDGKPVIVSKIRENAKSLLREVSNQLRTRSIREAMRDKPSRGQ